MKQPWPTARLEDLCTKIGSGGTPSRKKAGYYDTSGVGHLWVKTQELQDGPIRTTSERITDEGLSKSSARIYPRGAVLVAMYAAPTAGRLAWLEADASINQAICALVADPELADPRWVFYAIKSTRQQLVALAAGAAQQNLNQGHVRGFEIPVPPLQVQAEIGVTLRAFDELIENNRRRIEILEEMARLLYREWFVNFRFPGHENVEMVDSELGLIPDGWRLSRLEEVGEFVGGSTVTKAAYVDDGFTAFSAAGPDGRLADFEVDGSGVVLSAVGARCGRTFRASGKWSSIANTIKILPRHPGVFAWLVEVTADPSIWPRRGSAQPFVSINDARSVRCVVPPLEILEQFNGVVEPLFLLEDNLSEQIDVLQATRDLLLPRLVSGELDVSELDLDAVVGSVV